MSLKRTPLYERHVALGGKIIDFGGWELPVQYQKGILAEHRATRESAGLFDVSHMGEILVCGADALDFLQTLLTNDVSKIAVGETQYNVMCYENGGCVDDLIVYKYSDEKYLLVVNASNCDKDFDWISSRVPSGKDVDVKNVSSEYVQLALQGPKAEEILQKLTSVDLSSLSFFHFLHEVEIAGKKRIISRTGYTGEDGFEIYANADEGADLWDAILASGGDAIAPVGLGARDSLRFEAKLPLYGHEISPEISPLEAGLGYFVKLDKECDFVGKSALTAQKREGLRRKLREVAMIDRGIPRAGYDVCVDEQKVGFVTTGMFAPTLQKNIALAMLPTEYSAPGTKLEIAIRGKFVAAEVVQGAFYKKRTRAR